MQKSPSNMVKSRSFHNAHKLGSSKLSKATMQLFKALDIHGATTVSTNFLFGFLARCGLQRCDVRLQELFAYLDELKMRKDDYYLSPIEFDLAISSCRTLVHKAVTGSLKVPSFQENIVKKLTEIYESVKSNTSGTVAQYIPQLARVDPNLFAISLTTVDGQQFNIGDSASSFCIQSCSKPLSYVMALEQFGSRYVHNCIGTEPSGQSFNELRLKEVPTEENPDRQIPHNPMINAGAITATTMIHPTLPREERLKLAMQVWQDASEMGEKSSIGYDHEIYESESQTADRNWCLAYMMKEKKSFPPCFDYKDPRCLKETLELYFQLCSLTSTNEGISVVAATLANGGLNPCTGKRVFKPTSIRDVLPLMLSCGMYDYSGQWTYEVGMPAKSGVSGCIFIVIPNVCGISIYSPPLDAIGNSARGVQVAAELVQHFCLHNFEVFSGLNPRKVDITVRTGVRHVRKMADIMFAAVEGDVHALVAHLRAVGEDDDVGLWMADYDGRTPLHLAASEGQTEVVNFLIETAKCPNHVIHARDRWGGTAMDYARAFPLCRHILSAAGAVEGSSTLDKEGWFSLRDDDASTTSSSADGQQHSTSEDAPFVLFFAANGALDELTAIYASGGDLLVKDYDSRTALHLAASNNHLPVLEYILAHAGANETLAYALKQRDRWGNTPLDDAVREKHIECEALLRSATSRIKRLFATSNSNRGPAPNMVAASFFKERPTKVLSAVKLPPCGPIASQISPCKRQDFTSVAMHNLQSESSR